MEINFIDDKTLFTQEDTTYLKGCSEKKEAMQDLRASRRMSHSAKRKAKADAFSQENIRSLSTSKDVVEIIHWALKNPKAAKSLIDWALENPKAAIALLQSDSMLEWSSKNPTAAKGLIKWTIENPEAAKTLLSQLGFN